MTDNLNNKKSFRWLLAWSVAITVSVLWLSQTTITHAQDSRDSAHRQNQRQLEYQRRQRNSQTGSYQGNFQSGSEQSVSVLKEISKTLKSIDARLSRLEKKADSLTLTRENQNSGSIR